MEPKEVQTMQIAAISAIQDPPFAGRWDFFRGGIPDARWMNLIGGKMQAEMGLNGSWSLGQQTNAEGRRKGKSDSNRVSAYSTTARA